jgi:hypothetical protein
VLVACGAPPVAPSPPARASCVAIAAVCDPAIDEARVAAIVEHRCMACHGPGGIAGHDFAAGIDALRGAPVAEMVGTCQMPPDGAAEPERRALVGWAACQTGLVRPEHGQAQGDQAAQHLSLQRVRP